jgi:hypothetical protein
VPFAAPGQTIVTRGGRRVVIGSVASAGGQQLFLASGSFVVPAGVTSMCFGQVTRGGDAINDGTDMQSGAGGASNWINVVATTPGETLSIVMPTTAGADCGVQRGATWLVRAKNAATFNTPGSVVTGSGFSGGVGVTTGSSPTDQLSGGGAATGTGAGVAGAINTAGGVGGRGTSVIDFTTGSVPATNTGGTYGGGGGILTGLVLGVGASGALRAMWGAGRAYPNTNTADV